MAEVFDAEPEGAEAHGGFSREGVVVLQKNTRRTLGTMLLPHGSSNINFHFSICLFPPASKLLTVKNTCSTRCLDR